MICFFCATEVQKAVPGTTTDPEDPCARTVRPGEAAPRPAECGERAKGGYPDEDTVNIISSYNPIRRKCHVQLQLQKPACKDLSV